MRPGFGKLRKGVEDDGVTAHYHRRMNDTLGIGNAYLIGI
jgi:hypothetical protein